MGVGGVESLDDGAIAGEIRPFLGRLLCQFRSLSAA